MTSIHKRLSILVLSLLICFLSVKTCYWIAHTYFFDKFFYQKSTAYGYWIPNKNITYKDFGNRSKDIQALLYPTPVNTTPDTYKVIVIGDSNVWGQGIKENERFTIILENMLNKIRPTKVYSLGNGGDNIFDDYVKYLNSLTVFGKADLYIFGLYNNDLVFNSDSRYNTNQYFSKFVEGCNGAAAYYPTNSQDKFDQAVKTAKYLSLDPNSKNYCAYKKLLTILPKGNSLYVNLGSLIENWDVQEKFTGMITTDLNSINYTYNGSTNMTVSTLEMHPSALANKIYAQTIFDKINSLPSD